mmetsp:Transcript_64510/g.172763  ORF Transcript_64510/g.172763 Transcript_64510/m.172763 type:complete len:100 (+) Transcript_64510:296-595(+)
MLHFCGIQKNDTLKPQSCRQSRDGTFSSSVHPKFMILKPAKTSNFFLVLCVYFVHIALNPYSMAADTNDQEQMTRTLPLGGTFSFSPGRHREAFSRRLR